MPSSKLSKRGGAKHLFEITHQYITMVSIAYLLEVILKVNVSSSELDQLHYYNYYIFLF